MDYLLQKFKSFSINNKSTYVNGSELHTIYKDIKESSAVHTKNFITDNNLPYIIKSKKTDKIVDVDINKYDSDLHYIFIDSERLLFLITELVDKIETLEEYKYEIRTVPNIELRHRPKIINISEHELFIDANRQSFEIEVCGERNPDNIYFSVSDISNCLNMEHIEAVISVNNYFLNDDYTEFIVRESLTINTKPVKYLAFKGLLKILINSQVKCENKNKLRDWIINLAYNSNK